MANRTNVTRNTLLAVVNKINQNLRRPTEKLIEGEDGVKSFAAGHLSIETTGKKYQLVEYTHNGFRPITEEYGVQEMAAHLAGIEFGTQLEAEEVEEESEVSA